jgi:hypothetical protein
MATKRRRERLQGFLRIFIRPLRSSVFVEVKNGGRDVALVVAVAVCCASRGRNEDDDVSPSLSKRKGTWACLGRAGLSRLGFWWASCWTAALW